MSEKLRDIEARLRRIASVYEDQDLIEMCDELLVLAAIPASGAADSEDLSQPCPLCHKPVEREHSFALLESGGATFGGRKGYWHCWQNANGSAGERVASGAKERDACHGCEEEWPMSKRHAGYHYREGTGHLVRCAASGAKEREALENLARVCEEVRRHSYLSVQIVLALDALCAAREPKEGE